MKRIGITGFLPQFICLISKRYRQTQQFLFRQREIYLYNHADTPILLTRRRYCLIRCIRLIFQMEKQLDIIVKIVSPSVQKIVRLLCHTENQRPPPFRQSVSAEIQTPYRVYIPCVFLAVPQGKMKIQKHIRPPPRFPVQQVGDFHQFPLFPRKIVYSDIFPGIAFDRLRLCTRRGDQEIESPAPAAYRPIQRVQRGGVFIIFADCVTCAIYATCAVYVAFTAFSVSFVFSAFAVFSHPAPSSFLRIYPNSSR